jgi:aspartate aminotransferase
LGYAAGPSSHHCRGWKGAGTRHILCELITQKACVTALNNEDDSIEKMRQEFERRRDFLCNELAKIPHISFFKPKGAFYVLPDISWYLANNKKGIKDCDQFCSILLEKYHVALVSGDSFGIAAP